MSIKQSRARFVFFVLLIAPPAFAQRCSEESSIKARLDAQTNEERLEFIKQMEKAEFFGAILKWTSVAGTSMIPTLRTIARPGQNFNSFPGEAQIALAKLGDETALAELEQELDHSKEGGYAVAKLLHVGNDASVSLLMTFLKAHTSDDSLYHDYGDYGTDVRQDITRYLTDEVVDPPSNSGAAGPYAAWLDWWEQRKGQPVTLSISKLLEVPYSACLARKVEWGFPDAVLDMANTRDPQLIPALRTLEHVGVPIYTLNTVRGRAEFALAMLGDKDTLAQMEHDAYSHGSPIVVGMLSQIGGKRAVIILVNALDSDFPDGLYAVSRPDPKNKEAYAQYRKAAADFRRDADSRILSALNAMVVDPPGLSGDLENRKNQWKQWWAKNKDTAQFVLPPVRTYE
ncbi:MAG: hypothetical protein WA175_12835 [Candidatus Acidiferrales bacterium]